MGGLTSFASQAFQVLGAVNTVMGAVNQFSDKSGNRAYDAQAAANNLGLLNAQKDAALKKQQIGLDAAQVETERRAALRRAIAKQKAVYGASGTDSSSGSAQAVLLGKVSESEEDRQQRNALDALKTASVDEGVASVQRINTLQLTQLREKDKYNKYTSAYGLAQSFGDMLT